MALPVTKWCHFYLASSASSFCSAKTLAAETAASTTTRPRTGFVAHLKMIAPIPNIIDPIPNCVTFHPAGIIFRMVTFHLGWQLDGQLRSLPDHWITFGRVSSSIDPNLRVKCSSVLDRSKLRNCTKSRDNRIFLKKLQKKFLKDLWYYLPHQGKFTFYDLIIFQHKFCSTAPEKFSFLKF